MLEKWEPTRSFDLFGELGKPETVRGGAGIQRVTFQQVMQQMTF